MIPLLRHLIGWILGIVRSRQDLLLENMALRQQLLALHPNDLVIDWRTTGLRPFAFATS